MAKAKARIGVVDGRLTTTFSDGESDDLVALDASTGGEQWRYRISDTYKGHDGSDDGPWRHRPSTAESVMGQGYWGGSGFTAMYLALLHPETFSRAAAQSYDHGALEEDLMAAASGEKRDLELVFHWSSYDRFDPYFDFDARRDAKSVVAALEKNGYSPKIFDSNDGAGWGMWQGRTAEILEALFPLQ